MNACQDKIDLWTLTLTGPNYQQMVGFEEKKQLSLSLSLRLPPPQKKKNQEILNSFDALSVHIVCMSYVHLTSRVILWFCFTYLSD